MSMIATPADLALCEFIAQLGLADVPAAAQNRMALALADMAAVCVAGRPAPAGAMAAEHARALHPAPEAALLLDGSRAGATGAAFANGVLANVLDYDDGHRLTKGHPGAVIIPAALAAAQLADASEHDFMAAVIVGYEVAIRAGIALHGRDPAYHASGAWGAVGAAAAAARLLGLDGPQTLSALGLAEYHAPIAPIMRSCAEPRMTKDACAWGASVGVTSALLAARGFTSVRPELLETPLDDLGRRWRLRDLYVKPYPCCRWSQGAIAAGLAARGDRRLRAHDVTHVRVRVFAAADGLATVVPETTEEAQYSLVWPLACALVHGRFGVEEVLGPFTDPEVIAMFHHIEVVVDDELTAGFPARRRSAVEIELSGGGRLHAGPMEAAGEPDDPALPALVADKVGRLVGDGVDERRGDGGLRDRDAAQLLALMCDGAAVMADA